MLLSDAERGHPTLSSTRWSVVIAAQQADAPESREALAGLYQKYWPPLYWYIRRRGSSVEEAQDLIQEFFTRLMEKNYLGYAHQEGCKFRSFLLASFKHFLANEWDFSQAQKRGGGVPSVCFDATALESRVAGLSHDVTPEKLYERKWALTVLEHVIESVREEYRAAGKERLFEGLKPTLTGEKGKIPYQQYATDLDMSEGAVKVAVHRLRRRYRQLLKEEIAQTVATPDEIEEEIKYLLSCL